MWDSALIALGRLLDPFHFSMLLIGVMVGTVIGILPGLGGSVSVAILLSFIYKLDPQAAMALLVGSLAVVHTSDTITSVLIGTPGSAPSACTVLDGYPLARQGQAARALSAAFFSSMIGGFIGALAMFLVLPIARPLVLAFGSPELLMLCLLGLCFAGFLTGRSALKGLISGALGLLLGTVGVAPAVSQYRYTFDQLYLMDGLPLIGVALGLFALSEIGELLAKGGTIAEKVDLGGGWLQGAKDVIQHKWIVVRGSLIGLWAGVLPGIGASAGAWMSYGHVVAISRDREKFGKGDIRGVIAPEAANNSVEAGDLIPTLLFSVPGGAPAAIIMGALIVFGIQPGPRMLDDHLDITFAIIWSFTLANFIGAGLCFFLSPFLARLTAIRFSYLAPAILVTVLLGSFQTTQHLGDLWAMLGLGLLGWIMKHLGWPLPPFLIGFVLSNPTERYLWITVVRFGTEWLLRPGVIALGMLLLGSIAWGIIVKQEEKKGSARKRSVEPLGVEEEAGPEDSVNWGRIPDTLFCLFILLLLVGALWESRIFPYLAALLPMAVTIPAIILTLAQLSLNLRSPAQKRHLGADELVRTKKGVIYFASIAAFYILIWLIGFRLAAILCVFLFLNRVAGMSRLYAVTYTIVLLAAMGVLDWALGLYWPTGVLGGW
ncbi:MAG: tripartite tricarboxylate transporter permease [Deltaproteobacteria bacterium]|nr:tripartite tricarboxylate transporter permease [Deltaproteobacteria bacterium]